MIAFGHFQKKVSIRIQVNASYETCFIFQRGRQCIKYLESDSEAQNVPKN